MGGTETGWCVEDQGPSDGPTVPSLPRITAVLSTSQFPALGLGGRAGTG